MSDRAIFVISFLTVVLIVAGAFALDQFFFFELFKSLIYLLVAVMIYFGDNVYSYMLGIVAPPLWFLLNMILGGFFEEFGVLFAYLAGREVPPTDTPLHALAILLQAALVVLCWRAWKKEVSAPFVGKPFAVSLAISLAYVGVLAVWYVYGFAAGGRLP